MKESNFISCVIYLHQVYTRAEQTAFIAGLRDNLLSNFNQYEVILVNDCMDSSALDAFKDELTRAINSEYISMVNMANFSGVESSMLAGDDLAIGDYILEFEDLSMDMSIDIAYRAYKECLKGNDIVSVVPQNNRYVTSRIFYALYNYGVSNNEKIYSESFRVVSRRAYNRVSDFGKIIPYRKAFYASCGLKRAVIPYNNCTTKTKQEYDSMQMADRVSLGLDSMIIFTHTLQKLSFIISMFFLLLTIGVAVFSIGSHCSSVSIVAGWPSTILYMSVGFFGIFLFLTIILKYLSVIINIVLRNKNYYIESINKLSNQL